MKTPHFGIEIPIPSLEEILDRWKPQLGNGYAGYKNHACR